MGELAEKPFSNKGTMTVAQISEEWQCADPFVIARFVNHWEAVRDTNETLELYIRALYIFSEGQRPIDFHQICKDSSLDDETKSKRLGEILIEGQRSSNEEYDCSSPELEELCALAIASGAVGSKFSGAGWGGCSVSLVHKDKLAHLLQNMRTYYTKARPDDHKLEIPDNIETALFETVPGQGACIIDPSGLAWFQEA